MAVDQEPDPLEEGDYDEEADSDFDEVNSGDEALSSSSEDGKDGSVQQKAIKSRKNGDKTQDGIQAELDSGDEATIKERQKAKRRAKRKGEDVESGDESDQWKARTRAMRLKETTEKKRNRLASSKGSTIDVDRIWEEMNRSGPLPAVRMEEGDDTTMKETSRDVDKQNDGQDQEIQPITTSEETITIKRKFKFAGEVHVEEKVVPKSSAEARLWLSQQEGTAQPVDDNATATQRPTRKISRFDPNYNNLAAFKTKWSREGGQVEEFKGPKLNVVEKSKMDWASHVDAEGLKDELDVHAKAKEGYHSRMEFLSQVEQRKEEEARMARTKA